MTVFLIIAKLKPGYYKFNIKKSVQGFSMAKKLTRRDFIKISAGSAAVVAGAGFLGNIARESIINSRPGDDVITKVPTYCEMCTFKCAGWVHLKNGTPWKITGNENDDHSTGRLCTKGTAGIGSYSDPDRLKKPLIRKEERGKQVFREVSWDEALEYTAKKLLEVKAKHGGESIAYFYHGSGASLFYPIVKGLGSSLMAAPSYSNCRGPRDEGFYLTYGAGVESPEQTDMENSKCVVFIGSHIGENSHSAQVNALGKAISNNASIIVVDPRFSTVASKAKYWLPVKPATDMALILAWINVLIKENLYDKEYIRKYASGFNELKKSVKGNTPEWASAITTISADVIRETARLMAANAPATCVHPGRYVVWYGDDTQRSRAIGILNALLGSWGRKGGYYFPESVSIPGSKKKAFPAARDWKELFPGKFDLCNLTSTTPILEASLPDSKSAWKVKAWIVNGTNLMKTFANSKKTLKAISAQEFIVAIDTMPAEITGWADVVLPECTYLERYDDIRTSSTRNPQIAVRFPAAKPLYDSKPGYWIAKELGKKLGLGDYYRDYENFESYIEKKLKKIGTNIDEMKKIGVKVFPRETPLYIPDDGKFEFPTDSTKIELYSMTLKAAGHDPVPKFTRHEEPPAGYMRMLFGRVPSHSFGRTINNPILSQLKPENELWLNSGVAKKLGIKNGQRVRLKNQDGVLSSSSIPVKVTERIRSDSIFFAHGFGHTQKQMKRSFMKGIDDSELISKLNVDPISGGVGTRSNFVTLVAEKQDGR